MLTQEVCHEVTAPEQFGPTDLGSWVAGGRRSYIQWPKANTTLADKTYGNAHILLYTKVHIYCGLPNCDPGKHPQAESRGATKSL